MTWHVAWGLLALAAAGASTGAQGVVLELRPRPGDTVAVRLEHRVEMTGTRRIAGRDSVTHVASSMLTIGRTVVESVTAAHAIVATHTDSVALESSNDADGTMRDDARRALRGSVSRIRILPDGTAESVDQEPGRPGASWLAVMPGTLPREAIAVGARWTRTMPMPNAGGKTVGGQVRATFRLDSLTANGRYAWVSMRGTLRRDSTAGAAREAARGGRLSGTMTGGLTLDRKRGWVVYSVTEMTVQSLVPTPGEPRSPMRVTVRMVQRMSATQEE